MLFFLVPRYPLKKAENINFPRVFLLLCCSHKTYMKFLFGFLLSFVRATDAHRSILELCCSSSIIAAAFHPLHATHSMPYALPLRLAHHTGRTELKHLQIALRQQPQHEAAASARAECSNAARSAAQSDHAGVDKDIANLWMLVVNRFGLGQVSMLRLKLVKRKLLNLA